MAQGTHGALPRPATVRGVTSAPREAAGPSENLTRPEDRSSGAVETLRAFSPDLLAGVIACGDLVCRLAAPDGALGAAGRVAAVHHGVPHRSVADHSARVRCGDRAGRGRLRRVHYQQKRVHGRWSFGGYHGWIRGLAGKPIYPHRVSSLSDASRRELYLRAKIGINMHLSNEPSESGNIRMYEVPAHGALLLCDKAALDAHTAIFTPGVEAVFYDSIADAIAQIEYFATHAAERVAIARAGFERTRRDYNFEAVLQGLLDWASAIRRQDPGHG